MNIDARHARLMRLATRAALAVALSLALAKARLTTSEPRAVGMMLAEAMETAREWGATALIQRAALLQLQAAAGG